ncbi:MAG TPA: hypothetical protein VFX70_08345 [Mycobacteriales bacterium]|nr:hypothetical protein [Mycobacteriales bacterium]
MGDPGIFAQPEHSSAGAPPPGSVYGRYGLHHFHGGVQNLGQINKAAADHDRAAHGPFLGPIMHLINGSHEVDSKLSSTAKSLKQGLDLRSAPPAANVVYESIPHQTLYDSVTKGVSPSSVADVSDTWLQIGNKLTNLQDTVAQAIASTEVTWTGQAAEGARHSIAKLGNHSGQAGKSAQLAGVLTAQQSEALTNAKNSVPPPPTTPYNPQAAQQQLQTITDPIAFAKQATADHQAAAAQQASHQQAAHIVAQYDHTVSQTSASMPAFAPAPKVVKSGGPGPTPVPTVPTPGGPPPVGSNPPGVPTTPGPVGHQPGNQPTDPGGNTFTPPGTLTTTTSSFTPTAPVGTGMPLPGTGLPGVGLPGSTGDGSFGSFGTNGPGGFGGFGGFGGAGGSGGFGSAGSAGSGGVGGAGGTDSGSAGPGARSATGAGAGAAAEEAAMSEGSTAARGASRGMGAMGAGRGQRGQGDAEHKRPSWLVETDEGIFGTDQMTAPPVIGE